MSDAKKNSHPVLENIAKYEMTPKEAAAYKLAAMFEYLSKKMFPDYMHVFKMGKGDPRQSLAFRHGWKVMTEHGHELAPNELKLYVLAQLNLFKTFTDQKQMVKIDPDSLSGDKAWSRWKMYKYKMEKLSQYQTISDAKIEVNSDDRIVRELEKTKAYFLLKFKRHERRDIEAAMNDRSLLRWVVMKNVSGYYPYLSPVVKDWLVEKNQTISGYFGHALDVYGKGISPAAYDYFNREFTYEFAAGSGPTQATDPDRAG